MCGIAGFLELERRSGTQALEAVAQAMAAKLVHRGPDARGVFVDADAGVALSHTRLSIIDLVARRRAAHDVGLRPLCPHL